MPIEDRFLYAGNQAVPEATEITETTPYNALGCKGGSNTAQVVQHTHTASGTYEGYPNTISLIGSFRTGRGE